MADEDDGGYTAEAGDAYSELLHACTAASNSAYYNPASEAAFFADGVEESLHAAAEKALTLGVDAVDVYNALEDAYRAIDADVPTALMLKLAENGLNPNERHQLTQEPFLHLLLSRDWPPSKELLGALLKNSPNTDLRTPSRDTALHVLVRKLIDKEYFPNERPSLGLMHWATSPADLYHDDRRARYMREAFPLMLEAGFSPTATGKGGKSVVQLLLDGRTEYDRSVRRLRSRGTHAGHADMLEAIGAALALCGHDAAPQHAAAATLAAAAAAAGPSSSSPGQARPPRGGGPGLKRSRDS